MSYRRLYPDTYISVWEGPDILSVSNYTSKLEELMRPATIRRPYPADLFASGTTRSVTRIKSNVLSGYRWSQIVNGKLRDRCQMSHAPDRLINHTVRRPQPLYSMPASRDLCDTDTLLEIKSQKVNLTVSIAELGKTTDMVFDFFRDFRGFLLSLAKRDKKSLLKALKNRGSLDKDLAQKWLKFQYGVVPTMYEVYGLSEFIFDKIRNDYIYGTVRRNLGTTEIQNPYPLYDTTFLTVIRKNKFRYRVDSEKLLSLSQLGITNPAATVYELVPYSFVVDWFLGIGDYLATLDALIGIKDLRVIRGYTERYVRYHKYRFAPGGVYTELSPGEAFTFYRCDSRNAPVSSLKPAFPSYSPHLSTKRLISATALIRNILK